jgi:hypothetical protein
MAVERKGELRYGLYTISLAQQTAFSVSIAQNYLEAEPTVRVWHFQL